MGSRPRTALLAGLIAVVVVVVVAVFAANRGSGTRPSVWIYDDRSLVARDADTFAMLTRFGEEAKVTYRVSPLSLRNTTKKPIFIDDIDILSLSNVEIVATQLAEPSSPSLNKTFWTGPAFETPYPELEGTVIVTKPISGFRIEPAPPEPTEVSVTGTHPDSGKIIRDHVNDASLLVTFKLPDPTQDGLFADYEIRYRVGSPDAPIRSVVISGNQSGLCMPTGAEDGLCLRQVLEPGQ